MLLFLTIWCVVCSTPSNQLLSLFADIKFHATVHSRMIHTHSLILWGDHNTVTLLITQYQKKPQNIPTLWERKKLFSSYFSPCLKSWVLLLVINRRYALSRLSVTILWCIILKTIGLFVSAHTVSFLNKLIMGYTELFFAQYIYRHTFSKISSQYLYY